MEHHVGPRCIVSNRRQVAIVTLMVLATLSLRPIQLAEAKPLEAGKVTRVEIDGQNVTITVPIYAAGPAKIYQWTLTDPATGKKTVRYADTIPPGYPSEKDFLSDPTIAPEVLTREQIAEVWAAGAQDIWNRAFDPGPDNPYKRCLNLNLKVEVTAVDRDKKPDSKRHRISILPRKAGPTTAAGEILCVGKHDEAVDPWEKSCDGDFDPQFDNPRNANHVAHEVGHLLGFPDEYAEVTTQPVRETAPLPCRYKTLMAGGGGGGPPDCQVIVRLVQKIRDLTHNFNSNFPDDCPKNPQCKCQQPQCPEPARAGEIDFEANLLAFNKLAWGTYKGIITSHHEWTARANRGATQKGSEDWTITLKFWSQCEPRGCRKTPYMYTPRPTEGLFFGERAQGHYSYTTEQPRVVDPGTATEHFTVDHYELSGPVTAAHGILQPKDSQYLYGIGPQVGYPTDGPMTPYPPLQLEDKGVFGPCHSLKKFCGGTFTNCPSCSQTGHSVAIPAPPGGDGMAGCATALVGSKTNSTTDGHTFSTQWEFAYTPLNHEEWPEWERFLPKLDDGSMPRNMQSQVLDALNQFYKGLFSKRQYDRHKQLEQYRNEMKLFQQADFEKRWGPISGGPGGLGAKMSVLAQEASRAWEDSSDDATYQNKVGELAAAVRSFKDYRHTLEKLYADEIDQLAKQIQDPQAQTLRALAQKLRTVGIEAFSKD